MKNVPQSSTKALLGSFTLYNFRNLKSFWRRERGSEASAPTPLTRKTFQSNQHVTENLSSHRFTSDNKNEDSSLPKCNRKPFPGFREPYHTSVPNEFFDELLPHLSLAETRVVLYISRRTFGFNKNADAISLRQMEAGIRRKDGTILDQGTGLSRRALLPALRSLIDRGIICREERRDPRYGSQASVYSLRFRAGGGAKTSSPPGEVSSPPGEEEIAPHKRKSSKESFQNTPSIPQKLTEEFYERLGRKVSDKKLKAGEEEVESLLSGGFSTEEVQRGIEHVAKKYPDTQTIARLPYLIDEALSQQHKVQKKAEVVQQDEEIRKKRIEVDAQRTKEAQTWFDQLEKDEQEHLLTSTPSILSLRTTRIRWTYEKQRLRDPRIHYESVMNGWKTDGKKLLEAKT